MKTPLALVGGLLVLIGLLWTGQGLGIVGGGGMSGHAVWAVIGPIVALVGLVLVLRVLRRRAE